MENRIIMIIIAILLAASCKTGEVCMQEITDPYFKKDPLFFYIEVPRKSIAYKFWGGEMEAEYRFIYLDNSLIYVSNDAETGNFVSNYENIKTLDDSIFKIRFPNQSCPVSLIDTIELSGMDSDSSYWKDVKLGKFSIGYRGVSEKKKDAYEKALQTFRIDTCDGVRLHSLHHKKYSRRKAKRYGLL